MREGGNDRLRIENVYDARNNYLTPAIDNPTIRTTWHEGHAATATRNNLKHSSCIDQRAVIIAEIPLARGRQDFFFQALPLLLNFFKL